jgi:hypothetical protein
MVLMKGERTGYGKKKPYLTLSGKLALEMAVEL